MAKWVVTATLLCLSITAHAARFLFDADHGQSAGNADWVIDADYRDLGWLNTGTFSIGGGNESDAQPIPTPPASGIASNTAETYWDGAISAWAVDLVKRGHSMETLVAGLRFTYNAANPLDLTNYDVVVIDEPNVLFANSEKQALLNFVANGGSLFMISDHVGSDRNGDGHDSVDIWNDFLTNNGLTNNPFGITFRSAGTGSNSSGGNTFNHNIAGDPLLNGPFGVATNMAYFNGNEFQIDNTKNPTVISHMWFGTLGDSNNFCGLASLQYGAGRVVVCGDSSCFDDGTGDPNDTSLFDGYTTDAGGVQHIWILNASEWLVPFITVPSFTVAPTNAFVSIGDATGPFTPSSLTYTLSNTNATDALNWRMIKTAAWLDLSASNGLLAAGNSTNITVSINANAAALTPGDYSATVGFSDVLTNRVLVRFMNLTVRAPTLAVAGSILGGGDGDGFVDPSECNLLNLIIEHVGTSTVSAVNATLTSTTPGVTVIQPASAYPDLMAGALATNATPFQISTSPAFVCGTEVALTLTVAWSGGTNVLNYIVPRGFYTITQSTGARIVPGSTDVRNHCDDCTTMISLPFAYSLYDQSYTSVKLSSNGNLQFAGANGDYVNVCLPAGSFGSSIFAHWDDLRTDGTGGGIFTSISSSAPNRIFNIEWRAAYVGNGPSLNFEVQLYEGQQRFNIIYGNLNGVGASATVGVQKDNSNFTQLECNAGGLSNGMQLVFTITIPCGDGGGQCDSDHDGIPDVWMLQYFGHPTGQPGDRSLADDDADGDGMNNLQEFLTGTDPTNCASAFRITGLVQEANDIRLTWMTGVGRTNALERTAGAAGSFATNNFAPIFTVTNTVGATTNYLDIGTATNTPARYYRVRLVP